MKAAKVSQACAHGILALACVAAVPLASAAPLPEPALRLSPSLEAAPRVPEDERALLRVEWQAARSRDDEARIVDEIVASVRRMDGTVAQIRQSIEAWPAPDAPPRPSPPAGGGFLPDLPDLIWKILALAAAGLLLLWLPWRRRRPEGKAPAEPAAVQPEAAPDAGPVTISLELPPAPVPAPEPEKPQAPVVESAPAEEAPLIDFDLSLAASAPPPAETPPPPASDETPVAASIMEFGIEPAAAAGMPPVVADEPVATEPMSVEPAAAEPVPQAAAFAATNEETTDQAVELAEIMMSMGLSQGAAQTLVEQIRRNPKEALYHWLKLLDVYRRSEKREEYEKATRDLRHYFNVQVQDWESSSVDRSLEDYARLAERLQALWPTAACADFLKELLEDNRGGTRNGFPQSVAEEILLLQKVLPLVQTDTDA